MARRKHTPEQVINNLRQAEVAISEGSTVAEANRKIRVTEQTFYRWRAERPAPIACTSCYVSPTSGGNRLSRQDGLFDDGLCGPSLNVTREYGLEPVISYRLTPS